MLLLLNVVPHFYRIAQHLEPHIHQSQKSVVMCSYNIIYGFFKTNTFFPNINTIFILYVVKNN